uniref:Uncharacterized protein n=1 Tax=Meloidogyne hapla TaxID=6305 RepID=A0A1I8BJ39_MELHA
MESKNPSGGNNDNFLTSFTNIAESQKEGILAINYTKTFEYLLDKISNHCITDKEYEEFYGNKSKAGLVSWFFQSLVGGIIRQIGLNELRERLHLKKQKINITGIVEEEVENKNVNYSIEVMSYFQEKVHLYSLGSYSNKYFWLEDIQNGEKPLNKIFPEVL